MPTLIDETCYFCKTLFKMTLKYFNLNKKRGKYKNYCSVECANKGHNIKVEIHCKLCNKSKYVQHSLNDGKNRFCSKSCAASYNNTHKKHGTRRSKMEKWLEIKLTELYPELKILYNNKEAINSEIDVYIPELKLAIELNGIFHYEPIYGEGKLSSIQFNDKNKFKLCHEAGISLCIIDTSKLSYMIEKNCLPYLEIIIKIINENIEVYRTSPPKEKLL